MRSLRETEIRWTLDGGTSWPSSQPVLDLALAAMPGVTDDIAVGIIAAMAETIADLRDELRAVRVVLSASLTHAHQQHVEILRLRQRLAELHEARRAESRAA